MAIIVNKTKFIVKFLWICTNNKNKQFILLIVVSGDNLYYNVLQNVNGPDTDHTRGTSRGGYAYMDMKTMKSTADTIRLLSPVYKASSGSHCSLR